MPETVFFRLLKTPIAEKGDALGDQIAALNGGDPGPETFVNETTEFGKIPGSPFAYWVNNRIRDLFRSIPPLQSDDRIACFGLSTKDDFQFLRLSWEVQKAKIGESWFPFAKGGAYSPYYHDIHLLVEWGNDGEKLKAFANRRTTEIFGKPSWSRWINNWNFYFRPGLTWPRRTQKGLSLRAMPAGCIFSDKGPVVFVENNDVMVLSALLSVANSQVFKSLVKLQMAFGSYEVGVIQRTPVPDRLQSRINDSIAHLARTAYDIKRCEDHGNETAHAFSLPNLIQQQTTNSLVERGIALNGAERTRDASISAIQIEIDEIVFGIYNLNEAERELIRAEMSVDLSTEDQNDLEANSEADEEEPVEPEDLPTRVANLLMWCVGVAFGRWDVRMALDPSLLPALQGPFDLLPRCAPGALVGTDGLPATQGNLASPAWLRRRANVLDIPAENDTADRTDPAFPISLPWDGMLVDDPTHPKDIVRRVRQVLRLLWADRADAIEDEACRILGVPDLQAWFRDPRKGFFAFHIKRYSKSRRKAPIYWLLQSSKRNYAIWLYYHRLDNNSLYTAGRDYADAKIVLEQTRLKEMKESLDDLSEAALRRRQREIDRQQKLVDEVVVFGKALDRAALANLFIDHNDGVVLAIAPLREVVPWKEAEKAWDKLCAGEYTWSTVSQRMAKRGLIR